VPGLFAHEAAPVLRLHPSDAARRLLSNGQLLRVSSPRGQIVLPLRVDERQPLSGADLAMHWGEEFLAQGINQLTARASCPDSRQPELKYAAISIEPAALPWRLSACAWVPAAEAAALREALRTLLPRFAFAQCLPVASTTATAAGLVGLAFEAAGEERPAADLVEPITALLGLERPGSLRYADGARGRLRLLRLEAGDPQQAALQAVLRVGLEDEGAWLVTLWRERTAAASCGRWLLSPGAPPQGQQPTASPQVCNCFDVREDTIRQALGHCSGSPAERLAQLQAEHRCGTQCGSCLPALRRLVAITPEEIPA
jgi:assimilatory nitrate reductase catalytic subunit